MIEVIKLGGSLQDSVLLKDWLDCIQSTGRIKTVIVPGGGLFADQVRKAQTIWRYSDEIAHSMALLAMQQMALLFKGILPELPIAGTDGAIRDALTRQGTVIWSPDPDWLEQCRVPASWDVTSDSLAAWMAAKMNAERLILIKSAKIPDGCTISQLTEMGIVDKAFKQFTDQAKFKINFYSRDQITLFRTDRF